jgi:hypothetical protein
MRRTATLIALGCMFVVAVGGYAIGSSSPSKYAACSNGRGVLSLLHKGTCARGSHKVTLNAVGPRGPRGPKGDQGLPGVPGPGARTTSITLASGATIGSSPLITTGIVGVSVNGTCSDHTSTGGDVQAIVEVNGTGFFVIRGTALAEATSPASVGLETDGLESVPLTRQNGDNITDAETNLSTAGSTGLIVDQSTSTSGTRAAISWLVSESGRTFELVATAFTSSTSCRVTATVTPTNTANGST